MRNTLSRSRGANVALLLLGIFTLFTTVPAFGAEYFVSKQGRDTNSGRSSKAAFLTVQKGVNALKAGDTLTIEPGEYFENVKRQVLGNKRSDTVIRAAIAGTVTLRGDVDAPTFAKVKGYQFVYSGSFKHAPKAVLERDTLAILTSKTSALELEFEPGSFFYDEKAGELYISSSDLRPADQHHYTVAVKGEGGLVIDRPTRVVIDGLAVVGYYPTHGIDLEFPESCVVRNCVVYMNTIGICLGHSSNPKNEGGKKNLVEDCRAYGNSFGGVVRYYANNDIIRNCYMYKNVTEGQEHFGFMHYHEMSGPLKIKNVISWGHNFDISVKPSQKETVENCVGLGFVRVGPPKMSNCLFGGGNEYDKDNKDAPQDTILFKREKNLDQDFEFADPVNMDFRLQADSRFRNTGPRKTDRGVYKETSNVFYVTPAGNDQADGLSVRTAWKSLARALKGIKPGDTVYLTEGTYASAAISAGKHWKEPIHIRGRGRDMVAIEGRVDVTGSASVVFERIAFTGGASVSKSREIEFKNCTFAGDGASLDVRDTEGLRITHCVFDNNPVRAEGSKGLHLSANVYANANSEAVTVDTAGAVEYSDYNCYQNKDNCWAVGGRKLGLSKLGSTHDQYSTIAVPKLSTVKGVAVLANAEMFKGRGPHATALGIHQANELRSKSLVGPLVHSVTDTTANLEWWSSSLTDYTVSWGETPDMKNKVLTRQSQGRFTTYSLTGLTPGKKYYFRIAPTVSGFAPAEGEVSFTTAQTTAEPRVYHVSTNGSDGNDGSSPRKAFRSVSHAANTVRPGDTVLVHEGTYAETVYVRATGEKGKPITIRSAPYEKVTIKGKDVGYGFRIFGKNWINIDGFYFSNFRYTGSVFSLWRTGHSQITRCFFSKASGYGNFVEARYCPDLLISNCVAAGGMSTVELHVCPDVKVEHNLLIRPLITAFNVVNEPQQKAYLTKNIITDNLPYKVGQPLVVVGRYKSLVERDNCYMVRLPANKRLIYQFYGTAAYGRYAEYGMNTTSDSSPMFVDNPDGSENNPQLTLPAYTKLAGKIGSYVGDPKCAGTRGMKAGGKMWTGDRSQIFDKLSGKSGLDFPDTFVTDPEAVKKGIGPQPDAFKDFWFNKKR